MPRPIEITRLEQAISQFKDRLPRDLPDGVEQKIDDLSTSLGQIEVGGDDSPGRKEVAQVAGTTGTGEHYSKAAKGPDKPSPGQREAMDVSAEIQKAAESIVERVQGDRG